MTTHPLMVMVSGMQALLAYQVSDVTYSILKGVNLQSGLGCVSCVFPLDLAYLPLVDRECQQMGIVLLMLQLGGLKN